MGRQSSVEMKSRSAMFALAALLAAACATAPSDEEISSKATAMLKASFKPAGQAGLDRLDQDETQRTCSAAAGKAPARDVASKIEQANLATIRYPADGKLLGDWKNGEKIAQEGRGKQFSDDPRGPVGANCYACHQLSKSELSFGTIGPSLYQYRQVPRQQRGCAALHLRQDLQLRSLHRVQQHAAFRLQGHPDRAADQGRHGAAARPGVAGQSVRRRDFLRVLAAASAAGLSLDAEDARALRRAQGFYDVPKFGNVHILHFTDCHAQLLPLVLPRARASISVSAPRRASHRISSARLC